MTDRPIFTANFWADTLDRIPSAGAIAAMASVPATEHYTDGLDWRVIAIAFGPGAFLELLRSLAAAPRGNPGTAGFTKAIEASDQPAGMIARFISGGAP